MTGTVIANCITLDRVTIDNTWRQRRKVRKLFGCSLDALSFLLEGQSAEIGVTPRPIRDGERLVFEGLLHILDVNGLTKLIGVDIVSIAA